ncbi:hypothetical protein [Amycolatopsis thermophila]|uniref:Uncharacterized protein n=1 Tax=Amycolatopsis thermophila TaxID=206084 RepID=A0ABU0F515_9PSEU|nr:hypothetical protein [Amycolatopsis thermophila]MDQ0382631.1 hypothetical protein [Amycolatopsis thermophila]
MDEHSVVAMSLDDLPEHRRDALLWRYAVELDYDGVEVLRADRHGRPRTGVTGIVAHKDDYQWFPDPHCGYRTKPGPSAPPDGYSTRGRTTVTWTFGLTGEDVAPVDAIESAVTQRKVTCVG